MRVPRPMPLDFREMAEAVKKNNMGLGGFRLEARASVAAGKVALQPTGQSFLLAGNAPAEGGPAWRSLKVLGWEDPARTSLEILPMPRAPAAPTPGRAPPAPGRPEAP